ncbi:hypothetical protein RVS70_05205 [Virgibacillus sp. M23]|uniref:hypothetical protein n=1 Tax=Virgibacillus sp. M23 TaxID=3079030 RepID=UPI002A9130DC|nr:hypothetical protein [Virgibacillus sp. M23]MDY7043598.1 hypothetical protein [Virgibacillus sp. M23]
MKLKMYEFDEGAKTWICAESKGQAINIYITQFGNELWEEYKEFNGGDEVREMDSEEHFTYYHDGFNGETDEIGKLINKYCDKPDMFATSEF